MSNVFLWLSSEERGVKTDSTGAFRFPRAGVGPGLVQVEQAGYGRQYLPVMVSFGSPPLEIVLIPDSAALKGIPEVSDRLRARRNASPGLVRAFDQGRLTTTRARDARLVVQNLTFARVVACQGIARSHWCVEVSGSQVEPRVCIDGVPAPGGLDDLQRYRPHELYLLEVSPSGTSVRAYTHAHIEDLARTSDPAVFREGPELQGGVDALGWGSAREPADTPGPEGSSC